MLIASVDLGCSDELLTIVSMLSVENVFYRPKDKQSLADSRRSKFFQNEGDHLTLLNVYNSWNSSNYSSSWCHDNFIQSRQLKRASDIRKQLVTIFDRYLLPIESCGSNWSRICISICSGYFINAAKKDPNEGYKTLVDQQPVYIHPSSSLFNKQPEYLIFHQLVLTSKEYMRECLAIDPKWLFRVAPNFYKNINSKFGEISKTKKRQKIEPLFDRYHAPNEWRLSKRKG